MKPKTRKLWVIEILDTENKYSQWEATGSSAQLKRSAKRIMESWKEGSWGYKFRIVKYVPEVGGND